MSLAQQFKQWYSERTGHPVALRQAHAAIVELEQQKSQLIEHVEFLRSKFKESKTSAIAFQNRYMSGELMNEEPPEGTIYHNPASVADDCLWMAETCDFSGEVLPEIKIPDEKPKV